MKVWITRPDCKEYYLGAWRSVKIWLEKPFFDQRAMRVAFALFNPDTGVDGPWVYEEAGWVSETGGRRAKPFLKQDPDLMEKVRLRIYESLVPADSEDPLTKSMNEEEYDRLLNISYEMECVTHWKRFLLEVDIRAGTAELVEAEVKMYEREDRRTYPLTEQTGLSSYFLEGDLTRPYFSEAFMDWHRRIDPGI
jgi:hypothetical protein